MYLIYYLTFLAYFLSGIESENVLRTEVFIIPIKPVMFNWTMQGFSGEGDQFSYRPSLRDAPDLPGWISYIYSNRHRTGYLYGVPPKKQLMVQLEIVGLNRKSYETNSQILHMNILEKKDPAKYEVQLKIDNLNVEDMFDLQRRERLLDVFRRKLWPESGDDIYLTFLASAVQMGARLPLRPTEGEGLVMRLGSRARFSSALTELQDEVKPLWKLNSCPRDFKRTTVDRLFREEGFALDWCTFKLMEDEKEVFEQPRDPTGDYMDAGLPILDSDRWIRPTKQQVPQRSYVSDFVLTILVPMMVMIVLVLILSAILCFHHEGMTDGSSEYFDSIFDVFDDYIGGGFGNDRQFTYNHLLRSYRSKRIQDTNDVQMVRYAAVHRATHTLRSLSSQRQVSTEPESTLSRSRTGSPTSTLPRTSTPRISMERGSIYRPNPPPYTALHRNPRADF